jgi:signal transduction histidine kinase
MNAKFRVSSHLKDIIGRDLVTNEFIAIFELVKNSFDADATKVDIEFNTKRKTISIVDNGAGMSDSDIRQKWLFVAYSERSDANIENYRDKIRPNGQFAGSKGIGRFACDTLGAKLTMHSKTVGSSNIVQLDVDWGKFEVSTKDEFSSINVDLGSAAAFPSFKYINAPAKSGTSILISDTRHIWDEEHIKKLRRELAKLIDPFGTTSHVEVSTWLVTKDNIRIDGVDGPVGNEIADLLEDKTSRLEVNIEGDKIRSSLHDRGLKIYEIEETSPYDELDNCKISAKIYYLNRAAKATFTRRMGVRPVEFGSIFLFLNGFRIFPIGDENDDSFGLNRRKQQGQSRYLGTRDVLGRVDVIAPPRMFREVSSRDAGLIEDARSRALFQAITQHMLIRLERYVVGVNWKDSVDQQRDTPEGLSTDSARARVLEVVGALARKDEVKILYFNEDTFKIADDPATATKSTLETMALIAENRGDYKLVGQISEAKQRIIELEQSQREAREVARRALLDRQMANARIVALERQAAFLGSSKDVDVERTQLLMHQAAIHLGHLRSAIRNSSIRVRQAIKEAASPVGSHDVEDYEDVLASIRSSLRQIEGSLAGANLSSDRLGTVLSFAPNIRMDLETDNVSGDIVKFISEYISVRVRGTPEIPEIEFNDNDLSLNCEFSPVDMAIVIDNIVDNSRKAKAKKMSFIITNTHSGRVEIRVKDDGIGIDETKVDSSKIFERGYTSASDGTGLGLYSVRQIIEGMGGKISVVGDGSRVDLEITLKGKVN